MAIVRPSRGSYGPALYYYEDAPVGEIERIDILLSVGPTLDLAEEGAFPLFDFEGNCDDEAY
jgi:hypothetical protein